MTDYMARYNRGLRPEQLEQLPIFVFGTLRPGCGNDHVYRGLAVSNLDGLATLADHRLVSNGAFPYCIPAEGETTTGALIITTAGMWPEAMAAMDLLEGVPMHYDRVECTVTTPDGDIRAWYYLPDHWQNYAGLDRVPNNDWSDREPWSWRNRR